MAKWTVEEMSRLEASVIAAAIRDASDFENGQHFVIRRGQKDIAQGKLFSSRIDLRYMVRLRSYDPWEGVTGSARLTWTTPHFGGRRLWFLCGCCGRRVRVLFMSTSLACRQCLGLRYSLQQASRIDRGWGMRDRICDRLGGDPTRPVRPKGMHQKTYRKLLDKMESRAAMRLNDLARRLPGIRELDT